MNIVSATLSQCMFAGTTSLITNAAKSQCCYASLVTSPTPLIQPHLLRMLVMYSDACMLSSGQQILTMDSMLASLTITSAMGTYA